MGGGAALVAGWLAGWPAACNSIMVLHQLFLVKSPAFKWPPVRHRTRLHLEYIYPLFRLLLAGRGDRIAVFSQISCFQMASRPLISIFFTLLLFSSPSLFSLRGVLRCVFFLPLGLSCVSVCPRDPSFRVCLVLSSPGPPKTL